jgi:HD-like signal output (HDOD) protein
MHPPEYQDLRRHIEKRPKRRLRLQNSGGPFVRFMSTSEHNGPATRQQKLDACVERISREEGVPPFGEHANEVMAKTLDFDRGTSGGVGREILKDVGLTAQILRTANSALYNRSGRPISDVSHGIVMMGWDAVRNLVGTLRYINHFADRSPGLRELTLLSLLSAVHSRDIAVSVRYPRPEEAYMCGLFRNLGEVLIGCHYPEEYSKIVLAMLDEDIDERAACLRVLDFSWDEVAVRVAAGWGLPPQVDLCLRGRAGLGGSPMDRCLASITDGARELTHAMYRDIAAGDEASALRSICVINPEGRGMPVAAGDLRRLADSALKETQAAFASLGIPSGNLRLDKQAERARHLLASLPVFNAAGWRSLDVAAEDAGRLLREGDFELTPVICALLDALHDAGFDRAVFGLLNDDHTSIRGRLASGGAVEDVIGRFDFPIDRLDGPIRTAVQYKSDVLIDCSRDGRYDRSALVAAMEPVVFALFPIVVDHKVVGCLYADRQSAAPDLDSARMPLGRVRDRMAAAIKAKR